MSDDARTHLREQLFAELLVKTEVPAVETNAIEQELLDFAAAIQTGRAPRVTGADGRDAVIVAESILDHVRTHQWDGSAGQRTGPMAMPELPLQMASAVDAWSAEDTVILRRKAG